MSYVVDGVTYYTVRFLNYAGDDLLGTADVPEGGDATPLAPEAEVFEGKVFIGWNRDITNITYDKTVRPLYHNLYAVVFLSYDGLRELSRQTVEETHDAVPPEPEELSGLAFVEWDTDYTNVKSDLTIKGVYEVTGFTVRFYSDGGIKLLSTQYVDRGCDAIPPTPEVIEDKIFIGWNGSYRKVNSDRDIVAIYRIIPLHPVLNFYDTAEDGSSGELIKTYNAVSSCNIVQKLSGECTARVTLLTKMSEGLIDIENRLELEGLVFNITEMRKQISGGMCFTEFAGEHISYILNNEEYMVTAFEMNDSVKTILETLLAGTPFSIGTVDSEATIHLRINKECTRRAAIMQLVALAEGEIEYYGYSIGIRNHVGNTTPVDIVKYGSVQDISFSHNVSDNTTNYDISLYKKGKFHIGDELILSFRPMGIYAESRIVGIEWNPFNHKEVRITVGAYLPTLNDSLYGFINTVEEMESANSKYTLEFGELIGNGTFYFTRPYFDRPYYQMNTSDGSTPTLTLNRSDNSEFGTFVGATLSGVNSDTSTLLVFYCTLPTDDI